MKVKVKVKDGHDVDDRCNQHQSLARINLGNELTVKLPPGGIDVITINITTVRR